MTIVDRIMQYVWIQDDNGIVDSTRKQVGRVSLMHNQEQIERILIEEKLYSSHPCLLCGTRRTCYAKTKGGFQRVCDACRSMLAKADLLEPENQVVPMENG